MDGYLYYCSICDEALALSTREIAPRKISLVFDGACPGCGFELDGSIGRDAFKVPSGATLYTSPKCNDPDALLEKEEPFKSSLIRSSFLDRKVEPDITTGIRQFDRALVLKLGQLVVLQGKAAHEISLLLCARAISPLGINSDVVFVDGGNLFDTQAFSKYSLALGLDPESIRERIHLSRAFTHHQLAFLSGEKLALEMKEYLAKVAVISDISQLYCDPDVRYKGETLETFSRSIRFLSSLAEQNSSSIIITNLESRNTRMEEVLKHSAHVFARLDERGTSTQLTVERHPFNVQRKPVSFDSRALSTSLDEHFQ